MTTPSAPALPPDPYLKTEQDQAQSDLVSSLQEKTQSDMASLMARYGTQLALAGTYNPATTISSPLGRSR